MHVSLNQHLIPMFGTLRVDQIADAHVLAVKKLDLAAGTINKLLQLMGQVLRDAQAKGLAGVRQEGARGFRRLRGLRAWPASVDSWHRRFPTPVPDSPPNFLAEKA